MRDLTQALVDIEDIRKDLPIPYVMDHYGYKVAEKTHGKLHYVNPWRTDNKPSLDVFNNLDGVQRIGDMAEGWQGGVTDIVERELTFRGEEATDAIVLQTTRELYGQYLRAGWEGPEVDSAAPSKEIDPRKVAEIESCPVATMGASVQALMEERPGISLSAITDFGVRQYGDLLAFIYPGKRSVLLRNKEGDKTRVSGSKESLYHLPVAIGDKVILTEGESDTLAAHSALGGTHSVVGIPGTSTGTNDIHRHLSILADKEVVIAFDGDEAGREAATTWCSALLGVGCSVTVVPMPDGSDVSKLSNAEFRRLVGLRRVLAKNNSDLMSLPDGYYVGKMDEKSTPRAVSNWTLSPVRLLQSDDPSEPRTYEVEAKVSGEQVPGTFVLSSSDMSGPSGIHKWCAQFNGAWFGGNTDHFKLRAELESMSTFLPIDSSTRRPGLINDTFVYPGGCIGDTSVDVIPDNQYPFTDSRFYTIAPGTANGALTVQKLLQMHDPSVMRTMLSWFAMAPLRDKYGSFPTLFVTGRAGSGKTTLVRQCAEIFSGITYSSNLTSTTPYGVTLIVGSTNAYPVCFDEFRPGAARAAIDTLMQLIRDAYDGATSFRGGLGEDKSRLTAVTSDAPLVISGEDYADEQSHRDRITKVFVPPAGKGVIPEWGPEDAAFAHDYLTWLTERPNGVEDSRITAPPVIVPVVGTLNNRIAYNLGVINAGWQLLKDYCYERSNGAITLDNDEKFDVLLAQAQQESDSDAVLEMLHNLYESVDQFSQSFLVKDGELLVSPANAINDFKRKGMALPFSSTAALKNYLVRDLGGAERRVSKDGKSLRYVAVEVDWDLE